ncbi:MAG: hypothetical protein Tsb002_03520 [Wenzhouxiangellaceae bacterium]
MSRNANHHISYAASVPELRARLPPAFRQTGTTCREFDRVRDPLIAAQLKDLNKSEAQRRGEQGRGSLMVKLHQPFPELKPKDHHSVLRAQFNQDWVQEQRAAVIAQYRRQASEQAHQTTETPEHSHAMALSTRG